MSHDFIWADFLNNSIVIAYLVCVTRHKSVSSNQLVITCCLSEKHVWGLYQLLDSFWRIKLLSLTQTIFVEMVVYVFMLNYRYLLHSRSKCWVRLYVVCAVIGKFYCFIIYFIIYLTCRSRLIVNVPKQITVRRDRIGLSYTTSGHIPTFIVLKAQFTTVQCVLVGCVFYHRRTAGVVRIERNCKALGLCHARLKCGQYSNVPYPISVNLSRVRMWIFIALVVRLSRPVQLQRSRIKSNYVRIFQPLAMISVIHDQSDYVTLGNYFFRPFDYFAFLEVLCTLVFPYGVRSN